MKEHILLFSCCVSRAVYLESVPKLTTSEFVRSLKRLIARRGRPKIIYSDYVKTFKAGAKLLQKISKDERTNNLDIQYTNSPKVGQFERLIDLTKHSL